MNMNIHNMTGISRSKIRKVTLEEGRVYFTMKITLMSTELGYCKDRYSDENVFGDGANTLSIDLIADTKEALQIKVGNLI